MAQAEGMREEECVIAISSFEVDKDRWEYNTIEVKNTI